MGLSLERQFERYRDRIVRALACVDREQPDNVRSAFASSRVGCQRGWLGGFQ